MEFSAKQIATFIQGEIVGDENATGIPSPRLKKEYRGQSLSYPTLNTYLICMKPNRVLFWLIRISLPNRK